MIPGTDVRKWASVNLNSSTGQLGGCAQACKHCWGKTGPKGKKVKMQKVEQIETEAKGEKFEEKYEADLHQLLSSSESSSTDGDVFGEDSSLLVKEVSKRLRESAERRGGWSRCDADTDILRAGWLL